MIKLAILQNVMNYSMASPSTTPEFSMSHSSPVL